MIFIFTVLGGPNINWVPSKLTQEQKKSAFPKSRFTDL